ncbi:hypothetical protein [Flavobacterium sp. XGLA_31]|uniref:hypothetical protein n=1 Tax=Flavobacterium sp. XGLA_31 TaxID=3447666 RepID=UPI003F2A4893
MTDQQAKQEYDRLKALEEKLFYIRGEEADKLYFKLKGLISASLTIFNLQKQFYTADIEKFIKENKK